MRFPSLHRFGKISLLAWTAAAIPLGCEAQVLDPLPAENSGASASCTSSDDCESPTSHCDRVTGRCGECSSEDHCERGTCDRVTLTCLASCSDNYDCEGRRRRYCEADRGICVECFDVTHCERGLAICRNDICIECTNDYDCRGETDEPYCEVARNRCRECLRDSHCPDGSHCDGDEMRCESNQNNAR